jgi:two-component system sensor histidine kinase UhpB
MCNATQAQTGTSTAPWASGLVSALCGMALGMGLVIGLLAHMNRRDRQLPLLAALLATWSLYAAQVFVLDALPQFTVLRSALLAVIILLLARYLLGQLSWRRAWLDLALWLQVLAVPFSHLLVSDERQGALARSWAGLMALEAAIIIMAQLTLRLRERQRRSPDAHAQQDWRWMLAFTAASIAALGLELAALAAPASIPGLGWSGITVPLALTLLGLHAVHASTRGRDEAEAQLLALEQGQQEHLTAMERSFADMAEQKLEQVTERERKRIAADLHDDLGAKLLTIVHTSESDRISTLAREALEEMRLSVRGLTGKPVHLIDALGDWRAEVVSRLGQANILAEWKSPAEEVTHTLPARAYVQTTRILRESVSNIIKHSGATHCTVSCAVQNGDFQVVIQDNGQGISTEVDGRLDKGHGMASMKSRAKQMHGQCLVESGPGWGTVIRLTIPL